MKRWVSVVLGMLGWLLALVGCVDIFVRDQFPLPPPDPRPSVPSDGPWAGGPPIFWGRPKIGLVNDSSEPVFVESLSILGVSLLEGREERDRHLILREFPSMIHAALPIPAGNFTVSVRVRLERSGRMLAAELHAWVHAGYRCSMRVTIGADVLRAEPCLSTHHVDSDEGWYDPD